MEALVDPALLEQIPENDFLIYHDAGRALSRKPGIGYQFRRPVTPLIQAGMDVWKNTAPVREFVANWLRYCEDPRILIDQPNECGRDNFPDFQNHRHDQSVLTNLALKYKLPAFNPPPGELFKQRDIDYIVRRDAVEKLVSINQIEAWGPCNNLPPGSIRQLDNH